MAIARKKENPDITSSGEIVFREVVNDEEDLERKIEKLRSSCRNYGEAEKFRLYLGVNARNVMDCYFNFRSRMNDWMQHRFNGHEGSKRKFKRVDSHWKSELQRPSSRDETYFIWDLDDVTRQEKNEFVDDLPVDPELVQETPNGYHVVTDTFNYKHDLETEIEYERKNDGMLFLEYISKKNGDNTD